MWDGVVSVGCGVGLVVCVGCGCKCVVWLLVWDVVVVSVGCAC